MTACGGEASSGAPSRNVTAPESGAIVTCDEFAQLPEDDQRATAAGFMKEFSSDLPSNVTYALLQVCPLNQDQQIAD